MLNKIKNPFPVTGDSDASRRIRKAARTCYWWASGLLIILVLSILVRLIVDIVDGSDYPKYEDADRWFKPSRRDLREITLFLGTVFLFVTTAILRAMADLVDAQRSGRS